MAVLLVAVLIAINVAYIISIFVTYSIKKNPEFKLACC